MEMGLRSELAPRFEQKRTYLPLACYTLSRIEKKIFCQTLANLKVPEGYCSNFRNLVYVEKFKLVGLKSHNYHTLMQQLLPIALLNATLQRKLLSFARNTCQTWIQLEFLLIQELTTKLGYLYQEVLS